MSRWTYQSDEIELKHGIKVQFFLNAKTSELRCEWDPAQPTGILWDSVLPAYRVARNEFLASLDVGVLLIEAPGLLDR